MQQVTKPATKDIQVSTKFLRLLKCRVKVKVEQSQRVDRSIALPFRDLSARRGRVVNITPRPLYPQERPGTNCTGGWVGPRAGMITNVRTSSHKLHVR
jgi:hypothetical protein